MKKYHTIKQLLEEKYPLLKRELKPCFTVDAFADKLQRLCPIEYATIMSELTEKRLKWWVESYYLSRHSFIKRGPFKTDSITKLFGYSNIDLVYLKRDFSL